MRFLLVMACALVGGCGSGSETNSTTPAPQSLTAATEAELPACDTARESQLVYITDTQELRTCISGSWVDVAAPRVKMTGWWTCTGSTDLHPDADAEVTGMSAFVTTYSDGTAYVNCLDNWHGPFEDGTFDSDTSSGHRLYAANNELVKSNQLYCAAVYTTFLYDMMAHTGKWSLRVGGDGTAVDATCTQDPL